MIRQLRGKVVGKEPTAVILDVNGIGFELRIPLSTSSRLPDPGEMVELLVVMDITRAGIELFGFATKDELSLFRQITAVKGVGPKAALNLLSRYPPQEIITAIRRQDRQLLLSVPGIGRKKADELIQSFGAHSQPAPEPESGIVQQALNALESLGLKRKEALERLNRIKITPETNLQELIRRALAQQV